MRPLKVAQYNDSLCALDLESLGEYRLVAESLSFLLPHAFTDLFPLLLLLCIRQPAVHQSTTLGRAWTAWQVYELASFEVTCAVAASCEDSRKLAAAYMAQQVPWSEDWIYVVQHFRQLGAFPLLLGAGCSPYLCSQGATPAAGACSAAPCHCMLPVLLPWAHVHCSHRL